MIFIWYLIANWVIFLSTYIWANFANVLADFVARDSAEASAEASVDLTEASVSAESRFTPIRSFTTQLKLHL